MSIKFEGLDEVFESLDSIADEEKLQQALKKACARVEASAKQLAPKGRTGELARSITSKVEGFTGTVFTPLEYAPYVEFGTGLFAEEGGRADVPWSYKDEQGEWHTTYGMHPHPYMRPALYQNREEIIRDIKEAVKTK